MEDFELDDFDEECTHAEKSLNIQAKPDNEANGDNDQSRPDNERENSLDGARDEAGKMALGLHEGISNYDYHGGPGVSSTELKHELACSELFHAYDTGEVVFEGTRQTAIGTAVHALTLEPFDFDKLIAFIPKNCQGNAKNAKENKKEFMLANRGKDFVNIQEYDHIRHMRDALMKHPESGDLLRAENRQNEISGYYLDWDEETKQGTHMLCKYRPDLRLPWCLGDVKSTNDASKSKFSRTIGDFRYDVSAAHYLEGERILTAADHNRFFFLAVESKPPYLVAVYWLNDAGLKTGHYGRRKALESIKACRKAQKWPGYNQDLAEAIGPPSYLIYEMEEGL